MEGNFEIAGGSRYEGERFGGGPRHMTPTDMLREAGLDPAAMRDLDDVYPSDDEDEDDTTIDDYLTEAETRARDRDRLAGPSGDSVTRDRRRRVGDVRHGSASRAIMEGRKLAGELVTSSLVTNAVEVTANGIITISDAARLHHLQVAGRQVPGPGTIYSVECPDDLVRNVATLAAIPATYVPQGLHDMLATEGGPTLTVNAAPPVDRLGQVEGCIAGLTREGEAERGRYHYGSRRR
jgi:hypothetical protein